MVCKGGIPCQVNEFRMLRIPYIILCAKNSWNYITYDVTIELQKTRQWSPTLLSRCTLCNSRCRQEGGHMDDREY